MPLTLTVEDRLDIDQTIARYAHVLNNTDFDALVAKVRELAK